MINRTPRMLSTRDLEHMLSLDSHVPSIDSGEEPELPGAWERSWDGIVTIVITSSMPSPLLQG